MAIFTVTCVASSTYNDKKDMFIAGVYASYYDAWMALVEQSLKLRDELGARCIYHSLDSVKLTNSSGMEFYDISVTYIRTILHVTANGKSASEALISTHHRAEKPYAHLSENP